MKRKFDFSITIEPDAHSEGPREWDNLGTMACWHNSLILGDVQPEETPAQFFTDFANDGVILPLYLMDHSGLAISTRPFSCPWDSGQIGWILAKTSTLDRECGDYSKVGIVEILKAEVATYNQFLSGDVWCYAIEYADEHSDPEAIDSCCDIYGYEHASAMAIEAMADAATRQMEE